ncbi:MAG: aldehyde dehydrogenase [Bacteroidetes bacterium]|nr:MAG: aldehyde dehydrogenase [Bacteroidota bacterium]
MHQLVANQRTYFNTHATKSIKFRLQQLKRLKKVLQSNEALLYDAIYSDFKKSQFDTYISELALVYHDIDEACKNLQKWSRKRRVRTNLLNFPGTSYILPEPLGVCLVIGAWNYPYQLSLAPMVAAMAAGCTVVLKPSELPIKTSSIMAKIISENFSPKYIAVVEGGVQETTDLLQQKFDKIFFTGSTTIGKIVYKAAAENLTPVTLELSGKSPAFVLKDCNLKMVVKRLIWAKFLNAGQTCIAPDYVMVDRSIEQKFLALCKEEIEKEHFAFDNGNYTQIINDRNLERLQDMIDPAKVYYGGIVNGEQRYMEPTILQNVTFDDAMMQEEIFGPILPVISYDNLEEAIVQVRKLPKPLSCYVFTRSRKLRKKILNEISFGGGMVNDAVTHISNSNLPFGGVGPSGIGSYHGDAGFKSFTHYKGIVEKSTLLELPLKYYPHTKGKLWWIKRFIKF